MSSRDAHDLAIMRRELRASRRADGSIVARDIRGRRHEANVAAQWITMIAGITTMMPTCSEADRSCRCAIGGLFAITACGE